jgi:alpha-D-xyloside xylohydrolase
MTEAHEKGTPVMRPLFYDFPDDENTWKIEDEYMFGPCLLVAPIMYAGILKRKVYLPAGTDWIEYETGKEISGGVLLEVNAPLEQIPVFVKKGFEPILF